MAPAVKTKPKRRKQKKSDLTPDLGTLWIYETLDCDGKRFEFHPSVQDHIEKSWENEKQKCRMKIFEELWTVDFETMLLTRQHCDGDFKVERISRSNRKAMGTLVGVSGEMYPRQHRGFVQKENICNICLYAPSLPTRVDGCGHLFCYVCLKSNYNLGLDCPTCRGRITGRTVNQHSLVRLNTDIHAECPEEYAKDCLSMFAAETGKGSYNKDDLRRSSRVPQQTFYWIYKNKYCSGWYRYDPKNEFYMEECYARRKKICKQFICGQNMIINLQKLTQKRAGDDGHLYQRKIKRIPANELQKYKVRGIAGIDILARPLED